MHTGPLNLESLAARVEKLERQNRWLKRTGLALIGVPMAIAVMGQGKPATPKPTHIPTLAELQNQTIRNLVVEMDNLQTRVTNLETERVGRYQIAATPYNIGGVQFAKVFIVDTETGAVCQVVGENPMNGETPGTTLPLCTQTRMTITLQGNTYTKSPTDPQDMTPDELKQKIQNE